MNLVKPTSKYAMFYYICLEEATKDGLSLYEFYATHLEEVFSKGLDDFFIFLEENGRINKDFSKELRINIRSKTISSRKLDTFKSLTLLSEEEICFIVNFYITENYHFFNPCHLTKTYSFMKEHNKALSSIAYRHHHEFSVTEMIDGDDLIEERDDKSFKRWSTIYISKDSYNEAAEKEEIAENIYLLETIHSDDISKKTIIRLKELLNKHLNIDF